MEETERIAVSKESQKFVKDLSDLPPEKYHKVMNILGALEKQQDAEANLENKRGWRYMWQRTPKPYLLMLAYLVFLAPVGSFGYQSLSYIPENNQIFFSIMLLVILILPLLVVFYLSYNYVKQQKSEENKEEKQIESSTLIT